MEKNMRSARFVLFTLVIIMVFASGCVMEHEAEIDTLMLDFSGDIPGASVMVVRDGKPVFAKGYGLAMLDGKTPVTTKTNFRLASVTKQFTAMCIMQLIEQGKLGFDTTLCDIFPDFPAYGRTVTVHHMLQHSSGLISYESLMAEDETEQVHDDDVFAMMAAQDSTYFSPGSAYRYSNSGYAVLAMIVEKISGMSFPDYLRENIFKPLDMKNTVAFVKGVNTVPHRSFGYAKDDGGFIFSDQSSTSAVLGDGGIYSSVEDLFRWDQALYTDKLVSAGMLGNAFTKGVLTDGTELGYGYGWEVGAFNGHRRIMHMGGTCGFSTTIQRFPDERLTIIILTNRAGAGIKPVGENIAALFLEGGGDK